LRVVSYLGAFVAFIVPANSVARCGQPHDCNPTTITDREICDFHKVDNDLYRGARPTCSGLAKLRALGIRTFIDLGGAEAAVHDCEAETKKAGMHIIPYKINVTQIVATGVSDANLRQLFALIQRSPKPIFVGCSLGRDRTGTIVALYRMRRGEMSFGEALQEAQYYGYRRRFRGLRKALERYEDSQELRLLPLPSLTPVPAGSVCRPASVGSDH
jgi:tyrosine-protein phosphatase SIW14